MYTARILSNRRVCDEHWRIVLGMGSLPTSEPGQFIQLQCRRLGKPEDLDQVDWSSQSLPKLHQAELLDTEPLLRRPISIAGRRDVDGGVELDLIYRVIGAGTRWLSAAPVGTEVSLMGPLGNGFNVTESKPTCALIGGGVGIPPMIYLAQRLVALGRKSVAFCGIRSRRFLPLKTSSVEPCPRGTPGRCTEEFATLGVDSVIATDDGSFGFHGLVGEAFEIWTDSLRPSSDQLSVYCCGPEAMMRSIADFCANRGYECYAALERHMACGVGTCQSCICKIRSQSPQGWDYKLCCTDGPVFNARDIVW